MSFNRKQGRHLTKLGLLNEVASGGSSRAPEATPIFAGTSAPISNPVGTLGNPYSVPEISPPTRTRKKAVEASLVDAGGCNTSSTLPPWTYLFDIVLAPNLHCVAAQTNGATPDFAMIQRLDPGMQPRARLNNLYKEEHRNILKVIQIFEYKGSQFVAWEYMPFSLLHVVIRQRDLDDIKVASILRQILEGLAHLHKQKFEHGRLTCSAILIDHGGHVRICGHEKRIPLSEDRDRTGLITIMLELVNASYNIKTQTLRYHDLEKTEEKLPLARKFLETLVDSQSRNRSRTVSRTMEEMLEEEDLFNQKGPSASLAPMMAQIDLFVHRITNEPASMDALLEEVQ